MESKTVRSPAKSNDRGAEVSSTRRRQSAARRFVGRSAGDPGRAILFCAGLLSHGGGGGRGVGPRLTHPGPGSRDLLKKMGSQWKLWVMYHKKNQRLLYASPSTCMSRFRKHNKNPNRLFLSALSLPVSVDSVGARSIFTYRTGSGWGGSIKISLRRWTVACLVDPNLILACEPFGHINLVSRAGGSVKKSGCRPFTSPSLCRVPGVVRQQGRYTRDELEGKPQNMIVHPVCVATKKYHTTKFEHTQQPAGKHFTN